MSCSDGGGRRPPAQAVEGSAQVATWQGTFDDDIIASCAAPSIQVKEMQATRATHMASAERLQRKKRNAEAIADYRAALQLNPDNLAVQSRWMTSRAGLSAPDRDRFSGDGRITTTIRQRAFAQRLIAVRELRCWITCTQASGNAPNGTGAGAGSGPCPAANRCSSPRRQFFAAAITLRRRILLLTHGLPVGQRSRTCICSSCPRHGRTFPSHARSRPALRHNAF